MTKTFSAFAVVLMLSTPAFAAGENNNDGLPEQAVAVGQVDYSRTAGHWVKSEVQPAQQASVRSDAQQAANADIISAEPAGNGTN